MVDKVTNITGTTEEKEAKEAISPIGIRPAEISEEMQRAYLDYAMSVIVSRALPDVRDGLKPVQRRIIYAMQDQGNNFSSKFTKCAAVLGEVLKKYHPHGDSSVYDALVRMGQNFTLRYPLIIPQGNFGSIDGDPPAAYRYTECKLAKISEELFLDIEKETVPFEVNDLQNDEPMFLPSVLPNLLLNGASGIAVGMATSIPPHNLGEILDGINLLIETADEKGSAPAKDDPGTEIGIYDGKVGSFFVRVAKTDFSSSSSVEDLVKFIKGPDFPTGGIIYDQKEITQMYATGKGRAVTRAKLDIEEEKNGKVRIIVTEIPYQVVKATLVSKIADLVKDKRIEGISDLRDESNKDGMRIVIELKRDAVAKKVENQLFKYTPLQNAFNANMVALIDNEPKLMTLKMILEEFIKHRQQVVVKRTLYLLRKDKEREHILQGLKKALDNLDEIIKLIRASRDAEVAKVGLIEKFKFSEIQAQAILDMQLRKLAALERKKIEDELNSILKEIAGFETLLASPQKILDLISSELTEIKNKYADERKTKVIKGKVGELSDEDVIVNEKCIITFSGNGYIKRLKETAYKKQGRGGKGVKGQDLKEEDEVDAIKICNTHDWAFFFTNIGKVYKMRIWEIPESSKTAKGTPIVNFLSTRQDERIEALVTLDSVTLENDRGYLFFSTQKGVVKKTPLEEFANIRSSGIMAINLGSGDILTFVGFTDGERDILITTETGQSIRFSEKDVRDMGRAASGVTGIKLDKDDRVVSTVVLPDNEKGLTLLTVSEFGYGKKTKVSEYKTQHRSGSGILTYKVTDKTGKLVSARLFTEKLETDILIATSDGKVIRLGGKTSQFLAEQLKVLS